MRLESDSSAQPRASAQHTAHYRSNDDEIVGNYTSEAFSGAAADWVARTLWVGCKK